MRNSFLVSSILFPSYFNTDKWRSRVQSFFVSSRKLFGFDNWSARLIFSRRISVSYGFVIKSIPPAWILSSSSALVSLLVTKIIGTDMSFFIFLHISYPFSYGRLISSKIRSKEYFFDSSDKFSKSVNKTVSYPCEFSNLESSRRVILSSSIIAIFIFRTSWFAFCNCGDPFA